MTPIPPSPPVAGTLPELPPLPPARNVNCGVDLYIGLDIHEYAKAYALAAISAHEAEVGRLRRIAELVIHAADNRTAKDWSLMNVDLSEAAELARQVVPPTKAGGAS